MGDVPGPPDASVECCTDGSPQSAHHPGWKDDQDEKYMFDPISCIADLLLGPSGPSYMKPGEA